jgi:hypothetical protein
MQSQSEATDTNQVWTKEELKELIMFAQEIRATNEDLRAGIIAMQAKLENEERKVATLKFQLASLQLTMLNSQM